MITDFQKILTTDIMPQALRKDNTSEFSLILRELKSEGVPVLYAKGILSFITAILIATPELNERLSFARQLVDKMP